ncbi:lysophospholipid acyltransferase family protein [Pseudoalteromonas sp. SMS1]|uniref:lysophospholipid acyltransferase family protein n=1 Tax=Pseudoalteromonas sp. SMS1 TaxID=2908894 RepID=UPI001F2FBC31|nr:lysophospholipid acyltransferase family protein [Pseudoalteromonas sp. SMS1]
MIKRMSYLRRLILTGASFTLFGFGGIFLSFIVFPIQALIYRNLEKRKQVARYSVHLGFRFFLKVMMVFGLCKVEANIEEKLQNLKGSLILANHPSLIDVVVLISMVPNADCVVKAHLLKNPFMRRVILGTGYISNSEPELLISDCQHSLQQGNNLIIFPEGTRTNKDSILDNFQRGAANIALRCNASLTLLKIKVTPTTLTKKEKWYHIPEQKIKFSLTELNRELCIKKYNHTSLSVASRALTKDLWNMYEQELNING